MVLVARFVHQDETPSAVPAITLPVAPSAPSASRRPIAPKISVSGDWDAGLGAGAAGVEPGKSDPHMAFHGPESHPPLCCRGAVAAGCAAVWFCWTYCGLKVLLFEKRYVPAPVSYSDFIESMAV